MMPLLAFSMIVLLVVYCVFEGIDDVPRRMASPPIFVSRMWWCYDL